MGNEIERIVREIKEKAPPRSEEEIKRLSEEEKNLLLKTGIDIFGKNRCGLFFQHDHSVIKCESMVDGIEVMDIDEARRIYGLEEYWWKLISPDKDLWTKRAAEHQEHGYFIRALEGKKVTYPVQSCLYLSEDKLAQDVHNIVIAEEGSELHIITGCAAGPHVRSGLHVGISEFYVKKGAKLRFTMIHNWAEEMAVRPRSAIVVEEGGSFESNYICLLPAKDLQMYPTAILSGKNAVATFNTVLLAKEGSYMDTGSRVVLKKEGCRAEIISRTVSIGGTIIARGHLIGEAPGIKAHLECKGLLLSPKGVIHAIPELEGRTSDLDMSHEAAVGKIAKEEIEYLMARGLTEQEATSLIVKGFLSLDIEGLPDELKKEIDSLISTVEREGL